MFFTCFYNVVNLFDKFFNTACLMICIRFKEGIVKGMYTVFNVFDKFVVPPSPTHHPRPPPSLTHTKISGKKSRLVAIFGPNLNKINGFVTSVH